VVLYSFFIYRALIVLCKKVVVFVNCSAGAGFEEYLKCMIKNVSDKSN